MVIAACTEQEFRPIVTEEIRPVSIGDRRAVRNPPCRVSRTAYCEAMANGGFESTLKTADLLDMLRGNNKTFTESYRGLDLL
jgi:hypothetical protein